MGVLKSLIWVLLYYTGVARDRNSLKNWRLKYCWGGKPVAGAGRPVDTASTGRPVDTTNTGRPVDTASTGRPVGTAMTTSTSRPVDAAV